VDAAGNTIEFVLSPYRHAAAAEYFFCKALSQAHTVARRVINVDRNPAYPSAFGALQQSGALAANGELRPVKSLNNMVEQDHRFSKRRVRPGLGFRSGMTAWRTIDGYEAMNQ
jgi:transposase-like protein